MHGADEFLCRDYVILKREAVALVGHRRRKKDDRSRSNRLLISCLISKQARLNAIKSVLFFTHDNGVVMTPRSRLFTFISALSVLVNCI